MACQLEGLLPDDEGTLESRERPANWLPMDVVIWDNISGIRAFPFNL